MSRRVLAEEDCGSHPEQEIYPEHERIRVCYITQLTLQHFQFCMQLTKAYVAKTSCNQLFD